MEKINCEHCEKELTKKYYSRHLIICKTKKEKEEEERKKKQNENYKKYYQINKEKILARQKELNIRIKCIYCDCNPRKYSIKDHLEYFCKNKLKK
jgi:hypothetical protein